MIILGDYSVLCWLMYRKYKAITDQANLGSATSLQVGKLMWARLLNEGPDMIAAPDLEFRLILAIDSKFEDGGYWRTREIWSDEILQYELELAGKPGKYKGYRKEKTPSFQELYNIGLKYCEVANFPRLSRVGFEADDFAGLVVRRFKRLKDDGQIPWDEKLVLWTVDRDWSQLVCDHYNIVFANTRVPRPSEVCQERMVTNSEVARHTRYKYDVDILHPSELLEVKVLNGDWGDNLPPGECSRIYMDLLNPCPIDQYNLDDMYEEVVRVDSELVPGKPNQQLKHLADARFLLKRGRFSHILC